MSENDRPSGRDQLLYSEQAVRMLGANVRAALESQLTPEKVSQVFQEASERLAERLELPAAGGSRKSIYSRTNSVVRVGRLDTRWSPYSLSAYTNLREATVRWTIPPLRS